MKRGARKGGGEEIDAVKAFIVIMAVLTVGLGGFTFLFKKPERAELQKANTAAKKRCEQMFHLKEEVDRYLDAYKEAKSTGGIRSPEEYFSLVRERSRIERGQMRNQPRRESGTSRDFKEYYALITLTDISWDQAIRFMWNAEHNSPKYRILTIDDLRRSDPKSEDDRWKLSLKAAYRTQREE